MEQFHALVLQDPKPAPGEGGEQPQQPNALVALMPWILIFVVFWFILIRPSMRQRKEREAMLGAVKKNDHIVTNGGIFGVIEKVRDHDVILKIDDDVRIRVARSAIAAIEKTSGADESRDDEDKR